MTISNSPVDSQGPDVILHIGLHKTGTRFLQRLVFAELDTTRFNVNPQALWRAVRDATHFHDRQGLVELARKEVRAWRASGDQRTLLLTEPHFSGDMYSSHADYARNLDIIKDLFPTARIIFFVRKQSDWLHSAYRQQLVKGAGVPIEVFLNWYDGEFRPRIDRWVYGARNIEALTLRFLAIYHGYAQAFGKEQVYLFRQEDLRTREPEVRAKLAQALGIPTLPNSRRHPRQNKSYSALGISLFYPGVHRHYPQPTAKDTGPKQSRLKRWLRPARRLRRAFLQHVFDPLLYKDWDLLEKNAMRQTIDAHYAKENAALERIASGILEHGPVAEPEEAVRE